MIVVAFSMPYLSIVIFILNIVKHRLHVWVQVHAGDLLTFVCQVFVPLGRPLLADHHHQPGRADF